MWGFYRFHFRGYDRDGSNAITPIWQIKAGESPEVVCKVFEEF